MTRTAPHTATPARIAVPAHGTDSPPAPLTLPQARAVLADIIHHDDETALTAACLLTMYGETKGERESARDLEILLAGETDEIC